MESKNHLKPTDYDKTDVNILLLGETGVGKSTFINSFANYLQYHTLETAIKSKPICLIPSKFSMPDENFVDRIVEIGADDNEDVELGNSSTQGARAYVFRIDGGRKIRLIDTPSIGDSRGVSQDEINFESILSYIGQFSYLHAICFLLKPNVAVINAYFKFCIIHLMSRLKRSAAENIVFVFTNTRSSFYRPAETLSVLRRILDEIKKSPPYVEIPCKKSNMFCTDNESFKFLVALKQGVRFGDRERREFGSSWEASTETCWKLLNYITGTVNQPPLKPHVIQNTLSVNEARRCIVDPSYIKMALSQSDVQVSLVEKLCRKCKTVLGANEVEIKYLKELLHQKDFGIKNQQDTIDSLKQQVKLLEKYGNFPLLAPSNKETRNITNNNNRRAQQTSQDASAHVSIKFDNNNHNSAVRIATKTKQKSQQSQQRNSCDCNINHAGSSFGATARKGAFQ